jgi:hypothetical protein
MMPGYSNDLKTSRINTLELVCLYVDMRLIQLARGVNPYDLEMPKPIN